MATLKYNDGTGWIPVLNLPNATNSVAGIIKVQNNLTTTETGMALDATQGKILQDEIDDLSVDYIIEESTTTISSTTFTYRKWNSGFIEIWGEPTISFAAGTTSGGLYRSIGQISMLPLCVELYNVSVDYVGGGAFTGCVNGATLSTAEVARWTTSASSATTITVKLFMTGRWK